jgi:hypothetical protein
MNLAEIRKKNLTENILRQYKLLHEYEQARDLASDPKEIARLIEKSLQLRFPSRVTLMNIGKSVGMRS